MNREQKTTLLLIITSSLSYALGFITGDLRFFILAYALSGGPVIIEAVSGILSRQFLDENFLMTLASLGAIYCGQIPEAVAVMLFNMVGGFFENLAVHKSRNSISELMNLVPDTAIRLNGAEITPKGIQGGIEETIDPEDIEKGDIILVKPGEKIPVDGTVLEGNSSINTSALTGESLPIDASVGSSLLSGSVNITGLLKIRADNTYDDSTVAKVLDLVENSVDNKASVESFITKFARYYTPFVVTAAIIIAIIPGIITGKWHHFIYVAAEFLVVSCPCALVISVPLALFAGIGAASREGILVKGSNYLEALSNVETVAFDKTGTITYGKFQVSEINPVGEFDKKTLLMLAAAAERFSNHPVANSIIEEADSQNLRPEPVTDYKEISGKGIYCLYQGHELIAGNIKLMDDFNIKADEDYNIGTSIYVGYDGKFVGSITVADQVRENGAQVIKDLKKLGIKTTAILTGDKKEIAEKVGNELDVDQIHSQLLPADKVSTVEKLIENSSEKGQTVFVGDGINDAPVLARADVGVAMGAGGSDAAIEAADAVILTDNLSKLVTLIKIAKKTFKICRENIIFALTVKFAVMLLAPFGIVSMWACIFADVGVSVLAVFNSIRTLRIRKK